MAARVLGTSKVLISLALLLSYILIVEPDFITISLAPFSLKFAVVQGILSSLILGSPLLKGGPVHRAKPPGSLTRSMQNNKNQDH